MKAIRIDKLAFNLVAYAVIAAVALVCVIPFIMVLAGSFTAEDAVMAHGYGLWPTVFSAESYRAILADPTSLLKAYGVTLFITVTGTAAGLFLTAMTAYVLYRKEFRYRNAFAFFFYFTTLFNGGLVAYYLIMLKYYHMKDSLLALIVPLLLSPYYILIMRNFLNAVPDAIPESAKVDGAGEFTIFTRLCLPLMKPSLASIGMFIALGYWNDWYQAALFIDDQNKFPLQYMLYKMITNIEFLSYAAGNNGIPTVELPHETVKLAMTVVSIGPIVLIYPFVQKYFVKGLTVGAVKG
ncbi:putative aldouronate transport system permease protein [Paenibacillus sp. UNC496MF]|uniref:carbohydrate ABC transporter permease n=1 Tax=Paenibacillus sp. UNC496MF TaxID=1502753 RepID=UPI0008F40D87|nr:carbohydrate ABC transporter permease [Paenibacillus sp. UNC496MF]SFJ68744.1 putative aldouronate transport system permease protein [Paenibacillus sp. UNC496MF]